MTERKQAACPIPHHWQHHHLSRLSRQECSGFQAHCWGPQKWCFRGHTRTWHPPSWQPVPCGAACPQQHVWANTLFHVWDLSDTSKETKHGLSPMLRWRWTHRLSTRHILFMIPRRNLRHSTGKLQALGAASKPYQDSKPWHKVRRWGGAGSK